MSEWWTYSLSDALMFSPRVYYRLFELHNRALWPAQVLTLALGVVIACMLVRPSALRLRFILTIVGALWIWIAWAFFWERYATINWASPYVAPAFALEGLMLVGAGSLGRSSAPPVRSIGAAGGVLVAVVVVGYPLIAPIMGRPWSAAEVFGIAPDPTALATLAIIAALPGGGRWLLMIIPLLWVTISAATLWAMDAADFLVAPLLALAAIGITILHANSYRGWEDGRDR